MGHRQGGVRDREPRARVAPCCSSRRCRTHQGLGACQRLQRLRLRRRGRRSGVGCRSMQWPVLQAKPAWPQNRAGSVSVSPACLQAQKGMVRFVWQDRRGIRGGRRAIRARGSRRARDGGRAFGAGPVPLDDHLAEMRRRLLVPGRVHRGFGGKRQQVAGAGGRLPQPLPSRPPGAARLRHPGRSPRVPGRIESSAGARPEPELPAVDQAAALVGTAESPEHRWTPG